MQDGSGRIVVRNLTKHFGPVVAVQNLSFQVEPGTVTGFLGPNGAGKTTTLRMLLGLVRPTAGEATINGAPFERLGSPARVVGAVLEAQGFHPRRSAIDHLKVYASAMGVPDHRAFEVLQLVGLGAAAKRGAGGFSLGMKQRLALATALLGDPQVLVLDEPANGLDPEGIAWLRTFLKAYAAAGRTVLISSHLLAEVEQTIDHLVIVSRGQTVYNGGLEELRRSQRTRVLVQPADPAALVTALREAGMATVEQLPDGRLAVLDSTVQQVGDVAAKAGIALYGVQEERADLEQLFFALTSGQWTGQPQSGYPAPGYGGGYAQPAGYPPYQQQPGGVPPYQQPGAAPHYQQQPVQGFQQTYQGQAVPVQPYQQPASPYQQTYQQPQYQQQAYQPQPVADPNAASPYQPPAVTTPPQQPVLQPEPVQPLVHQPEPVQQPFPVQSAPEPVAPESQKTADPAAAPAPVDLPAAPPPPEASGQDSTGQEGKA
ncbi:ATP-binding cassette domain-containing protein [Actinokineospora enzanensis]|uniref:ABC transporter ATP-binding protein n=1 Tax=Actinokineospora enzanensis TaxID=155975 RepID=UPI000476327F